MLKRLAIVLVGAVSVSGCNGKAVRELRSGFIEAVKKMERTGELPTAEQAKSVEKYLELVWRVSEADLRKDGGAYVYGAFSRLWAEGDKNRELVKENFGKFNTMVMKTLWALLLLDEEDLSLEVKMFLKESLSDEQIQGIIREFAGPKYEEIVTKIRRL